MDGWMDGSLCLCEECFDVVVLKYFWWNIWHFIYFSKNLEKKEMNQVDCCESLFYSFTQANLPMRKQLILTEENKTKQNNWCPNHNHLKCVHRCAYEIRKKRIKSTTTVINHSHHSRYLYLHTNGFQWMMFGCWWWRPCLRSSIVSIRSMNLIFIVISTIFLYILPCVEI